jgi:hypothetical protein
MLIFVMCAVALTPVQQPTPKLNKSQDPSPPKIPLPLGPKLDLPENPQVPPRNSQTGPGAQPNQRGWMDTPPDLEERYKKYIQADIKKFEKMRKDPKFNWNDDIESAEKDFYTFVKEKAKPLPNDTQVVILRKQRLAAIARILLLERNAESYGAVRPGEYFNFLKSRAEIASAVTDELYTVFESDADKLSALKFAWAIAFHAEASTYERSTGGVGTASMYLLAYELRLRVETKQAQLEELINKKAASSPVPIADILIPQPYPIVSVQPEYRSVFTIHSETCRPTGLFPRLFGRR